MSVERYRGAGGADLAYRFDNYCDPWTDPPVVVLAHGFSKTSVFWYRWIPSLAARFAVVRPDLRGLGSSRLPISEFSNSLEIQTLDAIALLDQLGTKGVLWVGEATGALVGLSLARRLPDRVSALVLLGAPVGHVRSSPIFDYRGADSEVGDALDPVRSMEVMRSKGMRAWAANAAPSLPWTNECSSEYLNWYIAEMAREDGLLCAEFRRGMLDVQAEGLLDGLKVPTLYVDGDRDSHLSSEEQARIGRHQAVEYVRLEGPGIDIGYARPERSIAQVLEWLANQGAQQSERSIQGAADGQRG